MIAAMLLILYGMAASWLRFLPVITGNTVLLSVTFR